MANPTIVATTADTWTLIAAAVTVATVRVQSIQPRYLVTYRTAGAAAPTDNTDAQEVKNGEFWVRNSDPIDVYVKSETYAGSLWVAK